MLKLSAAVTERNEEFAQLEARDTGKSLKTARVDAAALARYFEFYGGACDKLHGETLPYETGYTVLTIARAARRHRPHHPVELPDADLRPHASARALAAGNACVVKPAEDASLSILRLAELAAEIGFPAGALNVVTGYGHEAGAALDARIPASTTSRFTGIDRRPARWSRRPRRSAIARSRWSSAASRRRSSSRMPTSTRRCRWS